MWKLKEPMIFKLLDHPYMIRRIVFIWMLIVFSYTVWWFFHYAETSPRSGVDIGAIIAAINAPLCYLFGAMMNFWKDVQNLPVTPLPAPAPNLPNPPIGS